MKKCNRGKSCGSTCINPSKACVVDASPAVSDALSKVAIKLSAPPDYSDWRPVAQGNYGKVSISPDGTRAVKELLVGDDGKKGEFGEFEVELATRMGELGHSPRVYRSTPDSIEMDAAKGNTLWKGYRMGEGETPMNATQATKAAAAIRDLHKMGFAHGDMHALQFIADGNDVKLVDY